MSHEDQLSARVVQPITADEADLLLADEDLRTHCERAGVDLAGLVANLRLPAEERLRLADRESTHRTFFRCLDELGRRRVRFVLIGGLAGRVYGRPCRPTISTSATPATTTIRPPRGAAARHRRRVPPAAGGGAAAARSGGVRDRDRLRVLHPLGQVRPDRRIHGVGRFAEADHGAAAVDLGRYPVRVLSLGKLIDAKMSTGRPKDLLVHEELARCGSPAGCSTAPPPRPADMTTTTSELARVNAWFAAGRLVRPRAAKRADAVDLVLAVAGVCGVEGADAPPPARRLRGRIGEHEHLVFVLIDGLGLALLRHLSQLTGAGFLAAHVAEAIEVVFPSTTACVLTSMATGTYPARHGVPGWWAYLDEVDRIAETLSFVDRFTKRPMTELGARVEDTFAESSMLPRFRHAPLVVTRPYIVGSLYSCWWAGGCDGVGYERIDDGVESSRRGCATCTGRPTPTSTSTSSTPRHQRGIDDQLTLATFAEIDRALERLHRGLAGRARLVASADHGHVNAADDHVVAHDHPLIATLRSPPSGEARVPVFHVRTAATRNSAPASPTTSARPSPCSPATRSTSSACSGPIRSRRSPAGASATTSASRRSRTP